MADEATQFNPDAFLTEQGVSNIPDVTQGKEIDSFDPDKFLQGVTSEVTGDLRPTYADGINPNTPINKSPLDISQRFKLGFGNEKGKINFLKENFEDATKLKNGDFVVKKEGLWYRVDPTGGGSGDAWSVSKEVIKDVADLGDIMSSIAGSELGIAGLTAAGFKAGGLAGTAVAPGAGTIAGGLAGGIAGFVGGALGGQALATKLNTSLGRYFGTYDATPDEQLEQIGIEAVLNLGGAILPAAVKPTGKVMANAFKTISKSFGKMSDASKSLVANTLGKTSAVGSENMEIAMKNPDKIYSIMSQALKGGRNEDGARQILKLQQINTLGKLADETRSALSKNYGNIVEDIGSKLPADYRAPTKEITTDLLTQLEQAGIGKLDQNIVSKGGAKPFKLFTREEILQRSQEAGNISEFAQDVKGYKAVKDFIDNINILASGSSKARGKQAFSNLRNVDSSINDSIRLLQAKANDLNLGKLNHAAKQLRSQFKDSFETRVSSSIPDSNIRNQYRTLKSNYSKALADLDPILKIQSKRAAGKNPDLTPTLNNLLRRGDDVKFDPEVIRGQLSNLSSVNPNLSKAFDQIKAIDAASSFIPKIKGNSLTFGLGVTSAVYNPALTAGIFAATSPRVAGATARGLGRVSGAADSVKQQLVKQGFATMNMLRTMSPKQLNNLVSNDEAVQKVMRMALQPAEANIAESLKPEDE